jgi:two-component system LytT family sensor kinase
MNRFDTGQKWQLALSLLVIYYPVLLYLNFPVHSPDHGVTLRILGYHLVTGLLIFLMYWLWIAVSEWVLSQLIALFGEGFMLTFNLSAPFASKSTPTGLPFNCHFCFEVSGLFLLILP